MKQQRKWVEMGVRTVFYGVERFVTPFFRLLPITVAEIASGAVDSARVDPNSSDWLGFPVVGAQD